jgi:uncharacterized phiE125 gp8 family phage protein
MPTFLLTGPSAEPLTLAEAKNFLRVEIGEDDDLIAALIAAARIHVEAETRRALMNQTWRLVRDDWPADGRLRVLPAPLRAVAAARVYDAQNVAHDFDPQAFVVDTAGAALSFAPWAVPAPGRAFAGIEIDISAGYGDGPADVPEPLRQAMRLLVAEWYDNRVISAVGQGVTQPPAGVSALIAPYRMLAL